MANGNDQQQVDPRLIQAIIGTESGGRSSAVGKAGELGLMQIKPKTGQALGFSPKSLDDPTTNVAAGTALLKILLSKYKGDIPKTLAAYNAGEGAVDRGQVPESTRRYVSNVLARMGGGMNASGPSAVASVPRGSISPMLLPLLNQMQGVPNAPQTPAGQQTLDLPRIVRPIQAGPTQAGQTLDLPSASTPQAQSMLERFKAAWAPGVAAASEGPPTAADIARDKARRASMSSGTMPSLAGGGPPSAADIAADKARRSSAPTQPWPVRAAGWAPIIGQTIGEYGAGAADLPLALTGIGAASEPVAMGVGGGTGYAGGELINRGVRSLYGLQNPTWGQEAKDTGIAAGTSAAMVPATRLLGKLAPASLKAGMAVAREQGPAMRAASGAAEDIAARFPATTEAGPLASRLQEGTNWLQQLPARTSGMLRAIDTMARDKIPARIDAMRDGVSTLITRAGEDAATNWERLGRMRQVVASLPADVMQRLYKMTPQEMTELIDTTMTQHSRWLQRPDLGAALKQAMDDTPYELRKYVSSHMNWARHWIVFKLFVNPIGAVKDLFGAEIGGRAMIGGSKVMNSPIMRRMYLSLLRSQTPHQVRLLTQAMISALITSQFTGSGQPSAAAAADVPRGSTEAPPAEAAPAEAPAAPPAAASRELGPLPPSDSTLEIPSASSD